MTSKNCFPFRFGTTSYIIPADILPNVEFLKDKVDDIELVLFESDEFSNLPSLHDMQKLADMAKEFSLTYSVHLPLDVYLGHSDRSERVQSVSKCLRIIELTRNLPKSAYVMHFEAGQGIEVNGFSSVQKSCFIDALCESIAQFLAGTDEDPSMFCVENLNYPFELVWPVVEESGLSVTLDVGHLEYYGFPTGLYLERYLHKAKVLHMHGTLNGKDHHSLASMKPEVLDMVMKALSKESAQERVMTLEIFSKDDFDSSCISVKQFLC
ncbi:MAG: sugar phosphate isomerase/epimerase [Chlorobiaceae bacterium]|nr:sugar phosphate isomerase/epimerase [Chlorobiaceae bacterium]